MTGSLERGIYLASRSPRRRDLLSQIGVRYHVLLFRTRPGEGPEVDETPLAGESPGACVERVARAKAESGWQRMMQRNLPQAPVRAALFVMHLSGSYSGVMGLPLYETWQLIERLHTARAGRYSH